MTNKSENSEIAVLQTQMEEQKATTERIEGIATSVETKLDAFIAAADTKYVPISTFNEFRKRRWAENTLSAVLGAVLTSIIGFIVVTILNKGV